MNWPQPDPSSTEGFDVAVVGYGPVGMTTAALLGRLGHRVVVLERHPGLYNLPRAAAFDGEAMRTWAVLGIAATLLPRLRPTRSFQIRDAADRTMLELDFGAACSGWAPRYFMYQPDLEDALDGACRALPGVQVRMASPVTDLREHDEHVTLQVGDEQVRARYVVACDGGNSFVREHLGIGQDDYGFTQPFLVADFRLRDHPGVETVALIADPSKPRGLIPLGPDHLRVPFILTHESQFATERVPEALWRRVYPHLRPGQAELIRTATYLVRSVITRSWRQGRVLLAGDAAHEMPPYLAQGMCSGVRDAQNLTFKLDLVLRGAADPALLDTYQQEREPHVRWITEKAIEIGRTVTLRDPAAAAQRDRAMHARREQQIASPPVRLPGLTRGVLAADACPGRGELSVQGVVDDGNRRERLDAVVGAGAHLIVTEQVHAELAAWQAPDRLTVVGIGEAPTPDGVLGDPEGTYRAWLADLGAVAVLVRPDFYVHGSATTADGARALAEEFEHALQAVPAQSLAT